ncbi:MAG: zinc ribbon domain-containing protein [Candidatus Contendobacter sp.]|nr:zinc ribbon domain-containing protein [Candidatus Contendobacter sp.]MDG4557060.1 zinc ribbon domain-containing protein [Candidatus Contendobacter sp.]
MPIYEYRCQSCDHALEALQKLSDPELSDCPSCGLPKLKKLISAVGFRLKGSGWYETDFKNGGRKNVVETDRAPASDSPPATSTCDGAGGCGACPAPTAATD